MCFGGGSPPAVKRYAPPKDPTADQDSARADNKAKLAALYGMSSTNKTGGLATQARTAAPTAFGSATTLGGK